MFYDEYFLLQKNSLFEKEKQNYGVAVFLNISATVLGVLFLIFIFKELANS